MNNQYPIIAAVAASVLLAGCAAHWVRTDGGPVDNHAGLGHFHFHVSSLTPLADGCASSSAFAPALGQRGLPLSVARNGYIR